MYILNISFVVEGDVDAQWLELVKGSYLPLLADRGYTPTLSRVLSDECTSHLTYSLLFHIEQIADYKCVTGELLEQYAAWAEPMFGTKVLWFNSLMKKI